MAYGSAVSQVANAAAFCVRDLETGEFVIRDHPGGIYESGFAFNPQSTEIAVAHLDGSVSAYRLNDGQRHWRQLVPGSCGHLSYDPSGERVAACGGVVAILNAQTGHVVRTWSGAFVAQFAAWHPRRRMLAVSIANRIELRDPETGLEVMRPWVSPRKVFGITFGFNHAGDRLFATDWSGAGQFWDANSGHLLLAMPVGFGFQFSPDDRLVVAPREGHKIRLWRLANGGELQSLRSPIGDSGVALSKSNVIGPDGRFALSTVLDSKHQQLIGFDLASGRNWLFGSPSETRLGSWSFANRKSGFVSEYRGDLFSWPVRRARNDRGQPVVGPPKRLVSNGSCTGVPAVSRGGRIVVMPVSSGAIVHDLDRPGNSIRLGPQFDVRIAAVSPDGKFAVTCSWWTLNEQSSGVRVWETASGRKVADLPLPSAYAAAFSPDGRWLQVNDRTWDASDWREAKPLRGAASVRIRGWSPPVPSPDL